MRGMDDTMLLPGQVGIAGGGKVAQAWLACDCGACDLPDACSHLEQILPPKQQQARRIGHPSLQGEARAPRTWRQWLAGSAGCGGAEVRIRWRRGLRLQQHRGVQARRCRSRKSATSQEGRRKATTPAAGHGRRRWRQQQQQQQQQQRRWPCATSKGADRPTGPNAPTDAPGGPRS